MSALSVRYNRAEPGWVIDGVEGAVLASILLQQHPRALVMASEVVAAGVTGPPGSPLNAMLAELRDEEDTTMVLAEWIPETQKGPGPTAGT